MAEVKKRGDNKPAAVETQKRVLVYRYVTKTNGHLALRKRWE